MSLWRARGRRRSAAVSPRPRPAPRSWSPWPASAIAPTYDRAGSAVFADTLSFAFAVGAVAVVGAVITLAVPGNRVGWLLLAAAAADGGRPCAH